MSNPRTILMTGASHSELASMPSAFKFQRMFLALCIVLAPLSVTLYLVTWTEDWRKPLDAAAQASQTGNTLHLIGGVAASFFLLLGYLGMSLLGMRRSPWLATFSAGLSIIGWIPWSALIGLDDLAYDIVQAGTSQPFVDLWKRFNGDAVMSAYLIIYIIGHLLSAVLIAVMLGRLRLIPAWSAWALALTSPITILYLPAQGLEVKNAINYLLCALSLIGTIPAAVAMFQNKDLSVPVVEQSGGTQYVFQEGRH